MNENKYTQRRRCLQVETQKVIKALKWIQFHLGPDTKPNTFENAINIYVAAAIQKLNEQEAELQRFRGMRCGGMSDWINVNDRLPNETQGYLVVLDNEDIDIRIFNSKNEPLQSWSSMLNKFLCLDNKGEWHTTDRVTHWMPLPELPNC